MATQIIQIIVAKIEHRACPEYLRFGAKSDAIHAMHHLLKQSTTEWAAYGTPYPRDASDAFVASMLSHL